MLPSIQFFAEPKSALPLPPPKEVEPTERSEKPMEITTVAAITGVMSFIQQRARGINVVEHCVTHKPGAGGQFRLRQVAEGF